PDRPHISSDISQCQKAGDKKQTEPRHFLRGAVKPSLPELSQIKQHFRAAQFRPEPASPSR
ncbi:hypothetical protein RM190_00005, partial [Paracoccus sp. CPCC 101403]